ncbi:hypothetical protein Hamer_G005956 [Homarus americanus]|uniref:Uncharacterized protein n=1 Tax=Homarus americanus TaxID=6706 RepID=A0A8J5MLW4_HOMAM|nr:hypothetical protein Hamer_G005956 [Homarus americanus]
MIVTFVTSHTDSRETVASAVPLGKSNPTQQMVEGGTHCPSCITWHSVGDVHIIGEPPSKHCPRGNSPASHPPAPDYAPEGPRYTILPTITVVSPWDDDDAAHHLLHDQAIGGSNAVNHIIAPTRVLPHLPDASTSSSFQRSLVSDAALNATQRFYDALRAVLHGSGPGTIPALGSHNVLVYSKLMSTSRFVCFITEREEDSLEYQRLLGDTCFETRPPDKRPVPGPREVCAALGVLVVVMVVLFHSHHFRRDCMTERRALRRVARRYHVTRAQDDVEKNDSSEVTDVTLSHSDGIKNFIMLDVECDAVKDIDITVMMHSNIHYFLTWINCDG